MSSHGAQALGADLLANRSFYGTNFTSAAVQGDGTYFEDKATSMNLSGDQWGVMNGQAATASPGSGYTPVLRAFSASASVDMIAVYLTGLATLLPLLLIPFIPGLHDIPQWIPVHRLIWRGWGPDPGRGGRGLAGPGPSPPARQPTGAGRAECGHV
jgi:hypothetical protein